MPTITDLLQQSKTGKIIIQYAQNKELTTALRNKLCNIIITYMEDNDIMYVLKYILYFFFSLSIFIIRLKITLYFFQYDE